MWRIRIHATYKTGMERICHTCVTNAFEICDEFVRILHTLYEYKVQQSMQLTFCFMSPVRSYDVCTIQLTSIRDLLTNVVDIFIK